MKKYIFAALTFAGGLFVAVLIQVFVMSGIFIQTLLYSILLACTIYVYNKFKNMEPALDAEDREGQLSPQEKEKFDRAFGNLDYKMYGIKEILAGKSKRKGSAYTLVIRTEQGLFKHTESILKSLGKEFSNLEKFKICLNTRDEELEEHLKAVYRIPVSQSSSTSQLNPES